MRKKIVSIIAMAVLAAAVMAAAVALQIGVSDAAAKGPAAPAAGPAAAAPARPRRTSPPTPRSRSRPPMPPASQFMREEEKLARDVYTVLGDIYTVRAFDNIARSESRHMAAVKRLMDIYSVPDPVGTDVPGAFTDPALTQLYKDLTAQGRQSLAGALRAGVPSSRRTSPTSRRASPPPTAPTSRPSTATCCAPARTTCAPSTGCSAASEPHGPRVAGLACPTCAAPAPAASSGCRRRLHNMGRRDSQVLRKLRAYWMRERPRRAGDSTTGLARAPDRSRGRDERPGRPRGLGRHAGERTRIERREGQGGIRASHLHRRRGQQVGRCPT